MKGGTAAIVVAAERIAALGARRAGLELVLCAGEETGCEGALALARAEGALGRVRRGAGGRADDELPVRRAQGRRVGRRGGAREDRPRLDAAPRRERDLQARAGRRSRSRTSRFDADEHPLLGAADGLARHVLGRHQHQLGARPRDGGDRRPHGAGADGRRRPRRRCANGSATRSSWSRAWCSTRSTPTRPATGCRTVFAVMGPLIGETPEPRGLAYFTDAAALSPAYGKPPTIICGPGDAEQAHRTDESCSVAALEASRRGLLRDRAALVRALVAARTALH